MSPYSWTQPACEACWRHEHPEREPVKLVEEERLSEICVYCSEFTRDGIYVRIDPNVAPFPSLEKGQA